MHVLPSSLALSQTLGKSGADFLTALVLGYEVQARIQWASRLRWPVHPHGNFGHVGAVAAIGKLSGWDAEQIREDLGLLSIPPYMKAALYYRNRRRCSRCWGTQPK